MKGIDGTGRVTLAGVAALVESTPRWSRADYLAAAVAAAQETLSDLVAALKAMRTDDNPVRLMVTIDDDSGDGPRSDRERKRLEEEVLAEIEAEAEIDEQIAEDFAERQELLGEENVLADKLDEHTADKPILSGGDLDAAWDKADVGEETVGGSVATPDQDRVDLLGEAVGLTYDDDEPLDTDAKLRRRDEHRWELDPRSADDEDDSDEIGMGEDDE